MFLLTRQNMLLFHLKPKKKKEETGEISIITNTFTGTCPALHKDKDKALQKNFDVMNQKFGKEL
jgi:hypothetical protein